jgi:hypothetical protein
MSDRDGGVRMTMPTDGAILPGHWTSRITNALATKAARQLVAQRHGRAGAALLRPGETTLTAHRITEHAHTTRPPASPTTRATAKATFAQAGRTRNETVRIWGRSST